MKKYLKKLSKSFKKTNINSFLKPYLLIMAVLITVLTVYNLNKVFDNYIQSKIGKIASESDISKFPLFISQNFVDPHKLVEEDYVLTYDHMEERYVKTDSSSRLLYGDREKGISIHQMNKESDEAVIDLSENQTIVHSLSPNKKYLVYTIANHKDSQEIEEGALTIMDLNTKEVRYLMHIPKEQTFSGVHLWDRDSQYFYFALRSSSQNLHFPDPETTKFYRFDLDSSEPTYLARGSDFIDGHIYIAGESINKETVYFFSETHGEYVTSGIWQYDINSGAVTRVLNNDYNKVKDKYRIKYFSILNKDFEKEELFVAIPSFDQNSNTTYTYETLDLSNGQFSPMNLSIHGSNILSQRLYGDQLFVTDSLNNEMIRIYNIKSKEIVEEFDPLPDHPFKFFANLDKQNNQVILQLHDYSLGRGGDKYLQFDDIRGIYDMKTKETKFVKYYNLQYPKSIITVMPSEL